MELKNKLMIVSAMSVMASGCNYEKSITHQDVDASATTVLFGINKNVETAPWLQSEKDGWAIQALGSDQVSMQSIGGVLINNNGTNDTADIQVSGNGSGMFMLKSDTPLDLSKYKSGFIEFKMRAKSAVPSAITVSIDNEWPVRSSISLASALAGGGNWETVAVPVNCLAPFSGATAVDLTSVANPFHLDIKETFDYELTDVLYTLSSDTTPVVDPVTCSSASDPAAGSGVNQAPALVSGDIALYYSGDISQASDLSTTYPLAGFPDGSVSENSKVVHASFTGNGGVFLGSDSANSDFSAKTSGVMAIDFKVASYGEASAVQLRMDGTAGPDYGLFQTIDNSLIPADDSWYRCHFPLSSLVPTSNLNSIVKALYAGGPWDSMANLDFSFTNVAITEPPQNYDSSAPCEKL